jgi:hypothetical protein
MLQDLRKRIPTTHKKTLQGFNPSPKDDFFRHYSFITVAAKSKRGRYTFRNTLYRLAKKTRVAAKYNRRVIEFTGKVAKALRMEETAG